MNKKTAPAVLAIVLAAAAAVFAYQQFLRPHPQGESESPQPQASRSVERPIESAEVPPNSPSLKSASTPEPTSISSHNPVDWKTYSNETYQYKVNYPPSASVATSVGALDNHNLPELQEVRLSFVQQFDNAAGGGQDRFGFRVTVYDNPKSVTAKEWALQQWSPDVIRKQEEIDLTGGYAYKLTIFEIDQTSDYIYLAKGNRVYALSYWSPDSMFDFTPEVRQNYTAIFQEMIDSFNVR